MEKREILAKLKEEVLNIISEREIIHSRKIIKILNVEPLEVLKILDELVKEGKVEAFNRGGYKFYKVKKV